MLATTYAYDHQGRLTTEKLKINQQDEITLAAYKYNKLGEQVAKFLHGSNSGSDFNQQVDYTYNEKGWMCRMNTVNNLGRDLFALDLRYNTPGSSDALTAGARYNGNISEMRWDTGTPKGFGFAYDGLNRLTAADYADGSSFTGNADYYNTSYTYDKNGNINLLNRYRGIKVDGLDYTYDSNGKSNRLLSVTDAGTTEGYRAIGGTYQYDSNGNLTTDPSKGTTISYNMLNLPEEVGFGANDNVRYTYDAAGNKRIKVVEGINAENNTRMDYSGNFLYENNDLKAIFTSAGRIVPFDNNGETVYKFEYNLQDHLGNTRVVFSGHSNGMPEVMQVTEYYPFGLVMNQQNYFADGVLSNKYLYNAKELQDDELAGNSLGWYDYRARFYDTELARFHTQDRFSEKYHSLSNYQYAANNPILNIDVNGDSIDVSSMSENERNSYISQISTRREKSKLFNEVYSALEESNDIYVVKFGETESVNGVRAPAQFTPDKKGGGTITFNNENESIESMALSEEHFHAYQYDNRAGYGKGDINLEFEATIAATIIGSESGSGFTGIGGMIGFQNRVGLGDYGSGMKMITPQNVTSIGFLNDYKWAANSYSKCNIKNDIGNQNYSKNTVIAPHSLQKMIKRSYVY